jgi:hypothetical protein
VAGKQLGLDRTYRDGDLDKIRSLSPDPKAFLNNQAIGPPGVGNNPLDYTTPLEEAEAAQRTETIALLKPLTSWAVS